MITTACPHCVDSDLKYICVYQSKRIMYLCASVSKYTCEYLCNYLVCVLLVHIFICVYVHGLAAQKRHCNGVQWESVLESLPPSECVYA